MIQVCTRLWPEPGPHTQIIQDSRYPIGIVEVPIFEVERRKNHIDLIDPNHALLPIAMNCICLWKRIDLQVRSCARGWLVSRSQGSTERVYKAILMRFRLKIIKLHYKFNSFMKRIDYSRPRIEHFKPKMIKFNNVRKINFTSRKR